MKKEDVIGEWFNIRPISYFRYSSLHFGNSYFGYICTMVDTLAVGFSREKFTIMNCDKNYIKHIMKKRYNIK